jgi:hypothetical protein
VLDATCMECCTNACCCAVFVVLSGLGGTASTPAVLQPSLGPTLHLWLHAQLWPPHWLLVWGARRLW